MKLKKSKLSACIGDVSSTFKAWRWAGIYCSSSPEPKLKIVTKDEDTN